MGKKKNEIKEIRIVLEDKEGVRSIKMDINNMSPQDVVHTLENVKLQLLTSGDEIISKMKEEKPSYLG